ncbi:MAG: GatB/YqeY domain-containing protein [Candidatus Saccharimonadales bacterium]
MALELQLEQDLKSALLNGDKLKVETLRGLKSVLLYAKVAAGSRDQAMDDPTVQQFFAKEVKKRQESIDLYIQGGNQAMADKEKAEKDIIEAYLPEQLGEDAINRLVETAISELGANDMSAMGKVIASVKEKSQGAADGAIIARLVKERLARG